MKTNIAYSSKMHLFIIISCALIAIGLLVGTVCHCVANGFFNYGDDYASYKSVTVDYENVDFSGKDVEPVEKIYEICDKAFSEAGVSSYTVQHGETTNGGRVVYKFTYSTDDGAIEAAVAAINAEIKEVTASDAAIQFSLSNAHNAVTLLGGGHALSMAAIAVAVVIVFHFAYFALRYKLTMALGAILADVHNLGVYVAILALTRIPVGASAIAFAVITVVMTVIGTCFLFDRMRKNNKDENLKKLSAFELSDLSANESFKINTVMPACLAALSVLLFVLLSISSLSPLAIISPVLCALVGFISCAYGTVFFIPAVYSRFKALGDAAKKKMRDKKAKNLAK